MYIKVKNVRAFVKSQSRRVGKDYLLMLDAHIQELLEKGCKQFNGSKITLDKEVAAMTGLSPLRWRKR